MVDKPPPEPGLHGRGMHGTGYVYPVAYPRTTAHLRQLLATLVDHLALHYQRHLDRTAHFEHKSDVEYNLSPEEFAETVLMLDQAIRVIQDVQAELIATGQIFFGWEKMSHACRRSPSSLRRFMRDHAYGRRAGYSIGEFKRALRRDLFTEDYWLQQWKDSKVQGRNPADDR